MRQQVGENKMVFLVNKSSSPETYLNKELLNTDRPRELRNNDQVSIGDSSFVVFTYHDCNHKDQVEYPEILRRKCVVFGTIGRGEYGKVKLAFDLEDCTPRAIKIVKKEKLPEKYREREVDTLRSVEHKHILRFYDMVESDECVYLIVEYVNGGELSGKRLDEKVWFSEVMFTFKFLIELPNKMRKRANNLQLITRRVHNFCI